MKKITLAVFAAIIIASAGAPVMAKGHAPGSHGHVSGPPGRSVGPPPMQCWGCTPIVPKLWL